MKRNRVSFILAGLLGMAYAEVACQPAEHFARDRTYDVLHYKLSITLDERGKTCSGDVGIKLVPLRPLLDGIMLDAADMRITQVRLAQKQLEYHLSGETLLVAMDKPYGQKDTLDLTVSYYVASPKKGMYFVAPDSGYPEKKWQVWTQGEAEDNHYWFPCYDFPNDLATSEITATVNDRFTVISNGRLLDLKRNPQNHTATYHWFEGRPHVSYLISLVAGEYAEVKDSWGTLPLSYYVYPHQQDAAMRSFGKTPKMIEFFSAKTGCPYPWEKYAQTVVSDFIYGGQENVSATTLTDATIHDARYHLDYSSDGLVAHELAHMWWGDMITCRDWSHAWLNEGFATYFENAFKEYDLGRDQAEKAMLDNQITLRNVDFGNNRRPTVCNRYINPMDVFDNRIYAKGAIVLNMLRFVLGDELFWKSINHYAHKFAFQNVETNDFKIAIEEATGFNLHWFFDQWLYRAGCPEFDVKTVWDQGSRSVQVRITQTQKTDSLTGIFITPVEIEVWVNGSPETYRVMISKAEEVFSFPAYQQPQLVIFDKGSRILKKVRFEKSADEWIYQLKHAEHGVDRFLAVSELAWAPDKEKAAFALAKAALEDPFSEVRREAVWTLGDLKAKSTVEPLVEAYGDRDAKVRAASVSALGNLSGDRVVMTLRHAFEKDSSYSVEAAALRSLAKADSANRKKYCVEGLEHDSPNEIIRSTAIQLLAETGDDEALSMITAYTRYGAALSLRIQAINAIVSSWKSREDVLFQLVKFLNDPSFHMRRAAVAALGNMLNPKAIEPLKKCAESEKDSRIVKDALEAIEKIKKAKENSNQN